METGKSPKLHSGVSSKSSLTVLTRVGSNSVSTPIMVRDGNGTFWALKVTALANEERTVMVRTVLYFIVFLFNR